jgi:hypothetical protein
MAIAPTIIILTLRSIASILKANRLSNFNHIKERRVSGNELVKRLLGEEGINRDAGIYQSSRDYTCTSGPQFWT